MFGFGHLERHSTYVQMYANEAHAIRISILIFLNEFFGGISDIDCGPLPLIEHGTINLAEQRTSFGVQATFTCHENYTLIGNENRTCELEGWSGKQPQCLVDWCPEPLPIAGGKVQLNGKRAGSTAVYECDAGYVLIGEPVSKCKCKWSGKHRDFNCVRVCFADYVVWIRRRMEWQTTSLSIRGLRNASSTRSRINSAGKRYDYSGLEGKISM